MTPTCPPDDALRRYLIGDYSDEQGAEIERHLSECPACEDTLANFDDTRDQILRHLPLAAVDATDDQETSPGQRSRPAWLDRLKAGLPAEAVTQQDDGDATDQPANPLSALDAYEMLGILGRGGMGVVYHARHRQLNRNVAIKVVHPKLTSALNARDRFEQEIRILGGMNHPGIVMATDAGRVGPAAYLVMELIDGINLMRLVQEQGPLSVPQATELARQVAEALAAAHASNAIHRDVKPSNVMLDHNGHSKLLDFGLAHLSERAHKHHETSLGHVLGTLDYMAPEQADGKAVQAAADVYGLGALLFYLLTGEPPHGSSPDRTLLQQLKSITTADARRLATIRADVPDDLSELVAQMLARDPADRPAGANQVAQSLSTWAEPDSLATLTEVIQPQRSMDSTDDDKDAVGRSLCALLGVEAMTNLSGQSTSAATKTEATPATNSRMFKNVGMATAIAAGMAAILFGITFLLDTPTGQVQIKSEVAGIQVELLDEKDRVTKLTVETKEKTTELKVGKYRVRLLEPHDGATLDKDTLTLTKGATTVATIRQITTDPPDIPSDGDTAKTKTITQVENVRDEPLYEGKPHSFWAERFEVELNPAAKLKAAVALLSFVSGSPADQVEQRIEIFGKLCAAKFGNNLPDTALEYCGGKSSVKITMSLGTTKTPKNPQASETTATTPAQLLRLVIQPLAALPMDEVVEKLVSMSKDDSAINSSYALIALSEMKNIGGNAFDEAFLAQRSLDDWTTPSTRRSILILRARLFAKANEDQQKQIANEMELVGRERLALDIAASQPNATPGEQAAADRDRKFERLWLKQLRRWKVGGVVSTNREKWRVKGIDEKLIARTVLYDVLNNEIAGAAKRRTALVGSSRHFYRDWTTSKYPYSDKVVAKLRDRSFPLWEEWVNVANSWLLENDTPENQTKVNRLLRTYLEVLPTRLADDDWDVETAESLMEKHLKEYYQTTQEPNDGAVSAHDLLTNILLCGGTIPDFVIANPPTNSKIRQRLAEFRETIDSDLDFDEYTRRSATAKGLIQVAPYHTLKCILTASKRPRYDSGGRLSPIDLIIDASDVKTSVNYLTGSVEFPPINPLLLLAIAAELSKEHGGIIDYRGLKSDEKMFHRHLRDVLRCPTAVGDIASRMHRKMYENASDEKKKEIEYLTPSVKRNADSTPGLQKLPSGKNRRLDSGVTETVPESSQ